MNPCVNFQAHRDENSTRMMMIGSSNGANTSLPRLLRVLDQADHIITKKDFADEYQQFCTTTSGEINELCVEKTCTISPSIFDYFHRSSAPPINGIDGMTVTVPTSSLSNNNCSSNTNCDAINMNLFEPTPIGPDIQIVRDVPASSFLFIGQRESYQPSSRLNSAHDLQGMVTPSGSVETFSANVSINAGKYQEDQWKLRFQDLLEFQRLHGHLMVPNMYPKNKKLSQWVKRQRYQYRLKTRGHHSTLTDEREKLLDQLGFVWNSHGASWNDQFQRLEAFYRAFGHIQVPSTGCAKYSSLSTWCKHQRREYRKMVQGSGRTTMTMERARKLESICFDWNPRHLVGATAGPGPM
ncbi:helicase domain protein [Nitzschia inconspicua]|uniref:Helicase domain protein n=1 Tax=Nitzschia inconspicua TaxID=303405 RepID=A0A9K3KGA6_9STRA|nr:helicase domain protein [Nitzschia inconspicua]